MQSKTVGIATNKFLRNFAEYFASSFIPIADIEKIISRARLLITNAGFLVVKFAASHLFARLMELNIGFFSASGFVSPFTACAALGFPFT